jgi:uncharacterized protein
MLFVLTFLLLYTAMHALVYWGIQPLLAGHALLPGLVKICMGVMILAPVLIRLLDRNGYPAMARGLAWLGYSWMGLIFLAFSLLSVVAAWHLLALGLLALRPAMPRLSVHGPACASVVLLLALGGGLYGFFEATDLRLERVVLVSDKLAPGRHPLRIVQVSDLHLGLLHRDETLAPVVSRIRELQPDVLVATGDVVDAQLDHLDGLHSLWHELQPPLGKFAVTGNHEYYAGLKPSLAYLEASGFTVLRGQSAAAGADLILVGVDDPAGGASQEEAPLLAGLPRDRFIVLLKHRPHIDAAAAGLFDLQLSGHTHRGQIFPFNLVTRLVYPLQNGLYPLAGGGWLYTSRGTGSWGPPMRLGAPPEITLIEIRPAPAGE